VMNMTKSNASKPGVRPFTGKSSNAGIGSAKSNSLRPPFDAPLRRRQGSKGVENMHVRNRWRVDYRADVRRNQVDLLKHTRTVAAASRCELVATISANPVIFTASDNSEQSDDARRDAHAQIIQTPSVDPGVARTALWTLCSKQSESSSSCHTHKFYPAAQYCLCDSAVTGGCDRLSTRSRYRVIQTLLERELLASESVGARGLKARCPTPNGQQVCASCEHAVYGATRNV
jgi:hypothetical protein